MMNPQSPIPDFRQNPNYRPDRLTGGALMSLQPTMLWESTDAQSALTHRFRFDSAEAASDWLVATMANIYGITVQSVDRLTISSYNLLAWLTTTDGPLFAKCCAYVMGHAQLVNIVRLLVWLSQADLPVSLPLATKDGERQVICDHLSLSMQRLLLGDLLDPTQPEQAHTAGVILARLHNLLAAYPQASDFAPNPALPTLHESIRAWLDKRGATLLDPVLVASGNTLMQAVEQGDLPTLAPQLVHHDYRAANLLWHEGQITAVLDFEELQWGYSVNDLTWAMVHLGTRYHNWGPVAWEVHQTFLAGYASIRPLTEAEQRWLLRLLCWHSLHLTATTTGGSTTAADVDPLNRYTYQLAAEVEKGII